MRDANAYKTEYSFIKNQVLVEKQNLSHVVLHSYQPRPHLPDFLLQFLLYLQQIYFDLLVLEAVVPRRRELMHLFIEARRIFILCEL